MCSSELFAWGLSCLVFGPPAALWPYKIARWGEIFDAIGRKSSGRVEPAQWNVTLTRLVGLVATPIGLILAGFCLL